jgi:hypothetical protein
VPTAALPTGAAPRGVRGAVAGGAASRAARDLVADPALDDALARIALLSARLHAVTDLHTPRRALLGGRVCRACGRPFPCPTTSVSAGRTC